MTNFITIPHRIKDSVLDPLLGPDAFKCMRVCKAWQTPYTSKVLCERDKWLTFKTAQKLEGMGPSGKTDETLVAVTSTHAILYNPNQYPILIRFQSLQKNTESVEFAIKAHPVELFEQQSEQFCIFKKQWTQQDPTENKLWFVDKIKRTMREWTAPFNRFKMELNGDRLVVMDATSQLIRIYRLGDQDNHTLYDIHKEQILSGTNSKEFVSGFHLRGEFLFLERFKDKDNRDLACYCLGSKEKPVVLCEGRNPRKSEVRANEKAVYVATPKGVQAFFIEDTLDEQGNKQKTISTEPKVWKNPIQDCDSINWFDVKENHIRVSYYKDNSYRHFVLDWDLRNPSTIENALEYIHCDFVSQSLIRLSSSRKGPLELPSLLHLPTKCSAGFRFAMYNDLTVHEDAQTKVIAFKDVNAFLNVACLTFAPIDPKKIVTDEEAQQNSRPQIQFDRSVKYIRNAKPESRVTVAGFVPPQQKSRPETQFYIENATSTEKPKAVQSTKTSVETPTVQQEKTSTVKPNVDQPQVSSVNAPQPDLDHSVQTEPSTKPAETPIEKIALIAEKQITHVTPEHPSPPLQGRVSCWTRLYDMFKRMLNAFLGCICCTRRRLIA